MRNGNGNGQTSEVLVVDGHALVRSGLRALLEKAASVEVVADAGTIEQAVQLCEQHHPDVVLIDSAMLQHSGEASIGRLLSAHRTGVLVLAEQQDPALVRRALRAGAMGYLLKRASETELVDAIRAVGRGELYLDPTLGAHINGHARPPGAPLPTLSKREVEIARLSAMGLANKEIASRLGISGKTVEAHRTHLGRKLGIRDRAELLRYALDAGLLGLEELREPRVQ